MPRKPEQPQVKAAYWRMLLATITAFLVTSGVAVLILYLVPNNDSSDPFAGLGIALAVLFYGVIGFLVDSVLFMYLFKVPNWLLVGPVVTVTGGLCAIFVSNGMSDFNWSPVLRVAVYIAAVPLIYLVIYRVGVRLSLGMRKRVVVTILAGAAMVGVTGLFALIGGHTQKADAGRQVRRTIEDFNFKVYVPSYVPTNLKLVSANSETDSTTPSYYRVEYSDSGNDNAGPLDINSFSKLDDYKPPGSCGPDYPRDTLYQAKSCQLIGQTPFGSAVYYASDEFGDLYCFTVIGNTEVVLATKTYGVTGPYNQPWLQTSEALKILDSVQSKTFDQLQKLSPQS